MEQKYQPSFIPKKQTRNAVDRVKSPTTLFYWVGVIVFILAIIISVWFFIFERFILLPQIDEKKLAIKKEIEAFDPELTNTLTILKQRINSGEILLARHVSASPVFDLIEKNVVQGVYFDNFTLKTIPGGNTKIEARGESTSYSTLAFQSEVLQKSGLISNPVFSDIDLNDKGRVTFALSADINQKVVSYSDMFTPVKTPPIKNQATSTESILNNASSTDNRTQSQVN